MVNTQESLVRPKVLNSFHNNYEPSSLNYMSSKLEQSKIPFKYSDNNINKLNNINKENNNILSVNNKKSEKDPSNDNNIKKIFNKKSQNILNNAINLDANPLTNKSIYRLLLFHIFHFFLPEKKKYKYQIHYMDRKIFKKKLDIYNYLNLLNRVDFLFEQILKNKNKKEKITNN